MTYCYKDDKIKIAGLVEESIVDGPGLRFVIFTQGCPHNCKGCHNPQTHDFEAGQFASIEELNKKICDNPMLRGVTLSGGEPFMQAKQLSKLISTLKSKNLDVITYTGFKFEDLLDAANEDNGYLELLKDTDILIDGKFEEDKKDESLLFKGSSNQRTIDVKKSLEKGRVIEYNFY